MRKIVLFLLIIATGTAYIWFSTATAQEAVDMPDESITATPTEPLLQEEETAAPLEETTVQEPLSEEEPAEEMPTEISEETPVEETPTEEPVEDFISSGEMDPDEEDADTINIDLDNVELEEVVTLFKRMAGINIVVNPTNLVGTVTVKLNDVGWRPALSAILDKHNLSLLEKPPGSQIYSIEPRSPNAPEPMFVETVFLRYAQVSNVYPVVRTMLAGGATASPFTSRNALVIRSTESNLGEIKTIIKDIDKLREQVYIEAKFMELNDDAISNLGINWQSLANYQIGASGLQSAYTEYKRETITDEYGTIGAQSRGWTRGRDLANNTPVAGTDLGLEAFDEGVYDVKASGKNLTEMTVDTTGSVTWDSVIPFESENILTAILGAQDFNVVLSALKELDGVSVVSNPKIIVANEHSATIHIGRRERPFISSITPGQQGIAPVVTYNPGDPVDFGVKLSVTPSINTESNITIRIKPELTRFFKDATAPNGQTFPIIATKEIDTVFCLESGKTAAIGGLTETEERESTKKIPLLGDIPLIGKYLFSHKSKERKQSETIIFVTVGMANPSKIEEDTGLPEDTELAQKHLIRSKMKRAELKNDLEKINKHTEGELERINK